MFGLMSGVLGQGMLDEVNSNFETNRIYNALSEDIIGNEIKRKSLKVEENNKLKNDFNELKESDKRQPIPNEPRALIIASQ